MVCVLATSLFRRFNAIYLTSPAGSGQNGTDVCQITWGPLSLLTALLIVRDSSYRHPIQALVSTGHVYGDTLYFATTVFDEFYSGKVYYRPEPFYFWIYFVLMNAVWLVIPGCKIALSSALSRVVSLFFIDCLYSSIKATATAFTASKVDAVERTKKKV